MLGIVSVTFALPYRVCPNARRGFRWVTAGGVLAVAVWLPATRPATNTLEIVPVRAKDVEGFGGRAPLLGHDHAENPVDNRPRCQRGVQLIGQHRLGGEPGRDADRDGRFAGEPLSQPGLRGSEERESGSVSRGHVGRSGG